MKPFEYVRPTTVDQAVQALASEATLPLAGGMDLVPTLQENLIPVARVVNLKSIEDDALRGIEATDEGLRIGALTTLTEIAEHPLVRKQYTALAEAAETVGSPQIRNAGTIGGNLCQRPRCWYFRSEDYHCLKKGGSRCFAAEDEADYEYHGILGVGPCYIVHPSNTATALLALNASVRAVGPRGERMIALDEFFVLPRTRLMQENVLDPGEIVVEVTIPSPPSGSKSTFIEMSEKAAFDWAISGAAVSVTRQGDTVRAARVVLHAVAPIPWRARKAEEILVGAKLDERTIARAAEAALDGAEPRPKNAYKVPVTQAMVRRALGRLA